MCDSRQMRHIIIVEGLIGVGKSTILSQVTHSNSRVFKEEYDEEKLKKHYETPSPRNSLLIQEQFYEQLKKEMIYVREGTEHAYLDRSLVGNLAFTLLNMSLGQLDNAEDLVDRLLRDLEEFREDNCCIVYLTDNIDDIQERVRKRGRVMERNLCSTYQRLLHEWYLIVLEHLSSIGYNILILDGLDSFQLLSEIGPIDVVQRAREYSYSHQSNIDIREYVRNPYPLDVTNDTSSS